MLIFQWFMLKMEADGEGIDAMRQKPGGGRVRADGPDGGQRGRADGWGDGQREDGGWAWRGRQTPEGSGRAGSGAKAADAGAPAAGDGGRRAGGRADGQGAGPRRMDGWGGERWLSRLKSTPMCEPGHTLPRNAGLR